MVFNMDILSDVKIYGNLNSTSLVSSHLEISRESYPSLYAKFDYYGAEGLKITSNCVATDNEVTLIAESFYTSCGTVTTAIDRGSLISDSAKFCGKVFFNRVSEIIVFDGIDSSCVFTYSNLESMIVQNYTTPMIPQNCKTFNVQLNVFGDNPYYGDHGFCKVPLIQMVDNETLKVVYPDYQFVKHDGTYNKFVGVNITLEHDDEISAGRFTLTVF